MYQCVDLYKRTLFLCSTYLLQQFHVFLVPSTWMIYEKAGELLLCRKLLPGFVQER